MAGKSELNFYLQPVGKIDKQILKLIGKILAETFGGKTHTLSILDTKPHFPLTGNWNAYQLALKVSMQLRPEPDGITRGIILGIVENGTFYTENFTTMRYNGPLDGYAALNGIVAVITLANYHSYLRDKQNNPARSDLQNLVLHEIGHIFGAKHCDQRCIMLSNASPLAGILPSKPEPLKYCSICAKKIRRHLTDLYRPVLF